MDKSSVIFGNQMTAKTIKGAEKSKQKFIKKYGDDATADYKIGFKPIDNIRVKITTLDSDHLVLTKDGQTWRFYKY